MSHKSVSERKQKKTSNRHNIKRQNDNTNEILTILSLYSTAVKKVYQMYPVHYRNGSFLMI